MICPICKESVIYGQMCSCGGAVNSALNITKDIRKSSLSIKITCRDEKSMKIIKKALEKGMIDIEINEK